MVAMFDLSEYSSVVRSILEAVDGGNRLIPLAPSAAVSSPGLALLRQTEPDALFDGDRPASADFAQCARSALFLYFSALDESHTISQSIPSAMGSYLHAIMHRQEPDYSNSKYWFRRVGRHELFPTLREECARLRYRSELVENQLSSTPDWDPNWFIDQCEQAGNGKVPPDVVKDLESIQRLEWRLVFDYSYRRALSG
jgi:hypothetical protein